MTGAVHDPLGPSWLESFAPAVRDALDGVAVVDAATRTVVYLNPSGRQMLGEEHRNRSPFPAPDGRDDAATRTVVLGRRVFEHRTTAVHGDGRTWETTYFRDTTLNRQYERRLVAFSRTSASIAFAGDLAVLLDGLAEEARQAAGVHSCTFLLMEDDGRLSQAGVSIGGYPGVLDDYPERLEACRALGAPLLSLQAFFEHTPLVAEGWREQSLEDPRFAPLHEVSARAGWSTLATVPVVGRGHTLGVLNAHYAQGEGPGETDLSFLSAIADQAAVAVENARLVAAVEAKVALEERNLLARELHDSVSQALFSLTLHARALEIEVTTRHPEATALRDGLADIRVLVEGALREMRALIFQLRPAELHDEGLVTAVRRYASAVSAREGLDIRVVGPQLPPPLHPEVEEQLFRVVQEALANVVKHAGAHRVHLAVDVRDDPSPVVELTVTDDGGGFDADATYPGHLGLQSMAERVAGVGGTLTITSAPGGTTVRAQLPGAGPPGAGRVGRRPGG